MQRSKLIVVQSIIIGALLLGVAIGGTLATENLPSSWKSSLNIPPSPVQQFNTTSLATEYDNILSLINQNQFSNASLGLSGLSFVNYPGNLQILAQRAISQVTLVNRSLPLASSYLSNTVDLISLGLLTNATAAINIGCTQAILANTSVYDFENITTPQLSALHVPTLTYSENLITLDAKVVSLAKQCAILAQELNSAFQSNGKEDCVKLSGASYCLALASPQKSVKVGGNLVIQGSLLENSSGIAGDTISFYLNGTYIANSRTGANGSYYANVIVPYVYAVNASIWAVASENSSVGLPIAIGSNAIFMHLSFNSTRIILDSGEFSSRRAIPYSDLLNMYQSQKSHLETVIQSFTPAQLSSFRN